jgi:hypothetical protein
MTTKATRHPKTPAQRAQETVDVLFRRLTKITAQRVALEKQLSDVVLEVDVVSKRLVYAKASPDLALKPGEKVGPPAKETTPQPTKEEAK